ncbi:hypothetical protein, partial [Tenacibaculum discolor]|uniref:hypothetical protein n=1 Tax=Tenacibaculum discolor TaxID=361581 RepID=UPI00191C84A9
STVGDNRFDIRNGDLTLHEGSSLDHGTQVSIVVTVTSTDSGQLITEPSFTIAVGDVNEAPAGIKLDNSSVAENAAGAVVGTLSTTCDVDDGDSHTYTVDDNRFEVVNGELTLKEGISLDHETQDSIVVAVTSPDRAQPRTAQCSPIPVGDVRASPAGSTHHHTSVAHTSAAAHVWHPPPPCLVAVAARQTKRVASNRVGR